MDDLDAHLLPLLLKLMGEIDLDLDLELSNFLLKLIGGEIGHRCRLVLDWDGTWDGTWDRTWDRTFKERIQCALDVGDSWQEHRYMYMYVRE